MSTCQVCGREIKTRKGFIVSHKHDKRALRGLRTRACLGIGCEPYEGSCDQVWRVIAQLKGRASSLNENVATLKTAPAVIQCNGVALNKPDDFTIEAVFTTRGNYGFELRAQILQKLLELDEIEEALTFLSGRLVSWQPVKND